MNREIRSKTGNALNLEKEQANKSGHSLKQVLEKIDLGRIRNNREKRLNRVPPGSTEILIRNKLGSRYVEDMESALRQ